MKVPRKTQPSIRPLYSPYSSLPILVGTCSCCSRKKCCNFLVFFPWIIVCVGNIGLDLVTSFLYYIDMQDTNSVKGLLRWMEISNFEVIEPQIPGDYSTFITTLPSLLMGLISSRFVIFFLFNVWFLLVIFGIWLEMCCKFAGRSLGCPNPTNSDSLL